MADAEHDQVAVSDADVDAMVANDDYPKLFVGFIDRGAGQAQAGDRLYLLGNDSDKPLGGGRILDCEASVDFGQIIACAPTAGYRDAS